MEETTRLTFRRELDALSTLRDELRLKAHLAKADVKDELNRLETKWQLVEEDLRRSSSHLKEPLEAIGQSTKDMISELKQSYDSIKHRFD